MKQTQCKVLIVGLGQIGGSIGYDLSGSDKYGPITGYDVSATSRTYARKQGAVDKTVSTLERGVASAEIVILCTPISETVKLLPMLSRLVNKEKVIIDTATTKAEIMKELRRLNPRLCYFSCHPMAGNEGTGIKSARKGMFNNADFYIIPFGSSNPESQKIVSDIARTLKANPIITEHRNHDRNMALSIGLPYALAITLGSMANELRNEYPEIFRSFGGSFRSATRVAQSSPQLVKDILLTNTGNTNRMIDDFIRRLRGLQKIITERSETALDKTIDNAGKFRKSLGNG